MFERPLPRGPALEAGSQPPQIGGPFQDRYGKALRQIGSRQIVGSGETGDAAANDGDARQASWL